jgi:hypothetical protein
VPQDRRWASTADHAVGIRRASTARPHVAEQRLRAVASTVISEVVGHTPSFERAGIELQRHFTWSVCSSVLDDDDYDHLSLDIEPPAGVGRD